jgi:signal transduction histidine kinase
MLLDGKFGKISAKQEDVLDRIQQNTQQLSELISGVLDLNRLENGHLPLDLCEIGISDLLHTIEQETLGLCSQSQLNFVWQIDKNLPRVCTDSAKLKMVIKNLIGNAIKFTKAGSVTVESHPHAGGVTICVADTGMGIPEESLPEIFEPYQQLDETRGQGTGLGLHIVKQLLTLLGGSITVESEVGRGSTFSVWVPATHSPVLAPVPSEPAIVTKSTTKSDTTLI